MRKRTTGLAALFLASVSVLAQQASPSATQGHIRFIFENPQLQPSYYVIDFNEDGSGHFQSKPGSASANDTAPQPIDTAIVIKEPLLGQIFKAAHSHNFFNVACDSMKSKVAFTGKKALIYSGPQGQGSCTFNWSHDQQLMKISDDLIAVAFTLEEGRRLAVKHEHDRLGLDAELQTLRDAAKAGRAQQLQNIAPQLSSIAADDNVMDRARQTARQLLNTTGGQS